MCNGIAEGNGFILWRFRLHLGLDETRLYELFVNNLADGITKDDRPVAPRTARLSPAIPPVKQRNPSAPLAVLRWA